MAVKTDFIPAITYEAAALSGIAGCFISSGVIGQDDLKVICSNGDVIVSEGKCILPDKRILAVPAGGYAAAKSSDGEYIYIQGGSILAGELPEEKSDILTLAHISGGRAQDMRKRAYIYTDEGEM